jgi:hypothetical protein
MKNHTDPLEQLFRAAAQAPRAAAPEVPAGLENRVLAAWRASLTEDDSALLMAWLRRAVILASVLVLASAAWSLGSPSPVRASEEERAITSATSSSSGGQL